MMNITLLALQTVIVVLTMFCSMTMLITLVANRTRLFSDPKLRRHPSVTIAVPVYNGAATIGRTLKSLLALDYPQRPEIIVVDDGSTDSTSAILRRFGRRIRVMRRDRRSGRKAVPLNLALKHAKGEIFGFIDADTTADRDLLLSTLGYFSGKDVGAVIPAMKIWHGYGFFGRLQRIEYMLAALTRKLLTFLNGLFLTPGCAFYRTTLLRRLGGFDTNDLTEDLEIGLRLRRAGWRIENSLNAVVWTVVPERLRDVCRQRIRWYRGMLQNIRKYRCLFGQRTDMGLFVMPFIIIGGTIGILLYFAALLLAGATAALNAMCFMTGLQMTGWDTSIVNVPLFLQPNIFLFLSVLFTVLFVVNIAWSARVAHESILKSAFDMLVFMLIYGPLLGLWWTASVILEVAGVGGRW